MCGVLGLVRNRPVAMELLNGLTQLQHRGQDAAGLATYDPETHDTQLLTGRGLVTDVFNADNVRPMTGNWGIGHVRYPTSGTLASGEAQPRMIEKGDYRIVLAYNGNLVNYAQLRRELEDQGCVFRSEGDMEVLLQLFARYLDLSLSPMEAVSRAVEACFQRLEGSYSVVGLIGEFGMFAFRDPRGIRPLLFGQDPIHGEYGFASETYPLTLLGYDHLEDVNPGELVFIDQKLCVHRRMMQMCQHSHCSFEYVYFAKANAKLEGRDVYGARSDLGRRLARKLKKLKLDVDVVMGVPNTSQPAAMAVAWELGIRLEEGFIRKDHTGRSFIMPTQELRERAVSQKLAPVSSVFRGNNVLIVDDSIVRGTVSRKIVEIARRCGAHEVYFASTFPPIRHGCFYGIDMPQPEQLLARGRDYEAIEEMIGADRVIYNDPEDLQAAIGANDLCMACVNGQYPTPMKGVEELQRLRKEHQALQQ